MVRACCVSCCTSNINSEPKVSFFVVPKVHVQRGDNFEHKLSKQRRRKWMKQLQWKNLTPTESSFVCSVHFVQGKPAKLWDKRNVDWVPTLKLGKNDTCKLTASQASRAARYAQRLENDDSHCGLEQTITMEEVVRNKSIEHLMDDITEELV